MENKPDGSPVRFYFDFSSPYAYLASQVIDGICARHGRPVDWRPILLGAIMQHTGSEPLMAQPLKGDYSMRDLARCARAQDTPLSFPDPCPFLSVVPARALYWLKDRDEAAARRLGQRLFLETFGHGRTITTPEAVRDIAGECGIDMTGFEDAIAGPGLKQRLREEVDVAVAAGVCGAPYFIVDDEPFWGADRIDHLDRWLESGGW